MRVAILSDIHANLEAFAEVEKKLAGLRIDRLLFLGDAVGYNADPDFCARRIAALAVRSIRGNHDKTVMNLSNLEWRCARPRASLWTPRSVT